MYGPAIQGPGCRRQTLGCSLCVHRLKVLTTSEQATTPPPRFPLTLGPADDVNGSESTALLFPLARQGIYEFKCVMSVYNRTAHWTEETEGMFRNETVAGEADEQEAFQSSWMLIFFFLERGLSAGNWLAPGDKRAIYPKPG